MVWRATCTQYALVGRVLRSPFAMVCCRYHRYAHLLNRYDDTPLPTSCTRDTLAALAIPRLGVFRDLSQYRRRCTQLALSKHFNLLTLMLAICR